MIIPMALDLTVRRNDNPYRQLVVFEDAAGAAIDMSTHAARLQVRLRPGTAGSPLLEALSSASSGTYLDMSSAGLEIVIAKVDIADLPTGPSPGEDAILAYDLLITPPGGDENAWAEGAVICKPGVTA